MSPTAHAPTLTTVAGKFSHPPDLPVPNRLNLALVLLVFTLALTLLWLASAVSNIWAVIAIGVVFSYVLLTNYALLHEAAHANLQSSVWRNHVLGVLAGLLFPIPFSMICLTHQGHHLHNRTDAEMFDLYYPHDNRLLKYLRWYAILGGLFWPLIPLGAVLFAMLPGPLRRRLFDRQKSTGYMFASAQRASVWRSARNWD